MAPPTPTRKSGGEPVRSTQATANDATRNINRSSSGDGGDGNAAAATAAEESEEEFTTEEFEVELDDGATWAMNFYECAAEGDVTFLKQILDDAKVDVNDTDVDGFTALMIAAAEGHKHIVLELLERGADVAVRTHELRSTALHFAAKNGDAEIVDAICKKDPRYVDCWNINADTPLIWACIEGRAECVRVLLSYNADVDVVNQYGATALICSVMIGEDPEEDESDDARSEIIKMLLAKYETNPKLVNFQDREGSTAMHLAASCGYLQCVKTLLECGADITLRNAIGQTPLEEAEQTGLDESDVCVDHLRTIWQNLEEEAAARMMTMLEMEEQSARGGGGAAASKTGNGGVANNNVGVGGIASSSSKKSKKKNKKQKRKAAKQQAQASGDLGTPTEVGISNTSSQDDSKIAESSNNAVSSGESSDEDEIEKTESAETGGVQSVVTLTETSSETQDPEPSEDNAGISGVWTTVGKKQHKSAAATTAAQEDADADAAVMEKDQSGSHDGSRSSAAAPGGRANKSPTQKVVPFRRKFKQNQYESGGSGSAVLGGSSSVSSAIAFASSAKVTPGNTNKGVPTSETPRVGVSTPMFSRVTASSTASIGLNHSALPYSSTPMFSSSISSSAYSSPFITRNQERVRNHLGFSSSWRSSGFGSSTTGSAVPTSSAASATGYTSANRSLWKHSQRVSGNQLAAVEAKDKWVSRLHLTNENVSEAIGYLACGICGELVNDNLQCNVSVNGSGCAQLYCGTCLAKTLATSVGLSLKCVKCHQFMNRDEMQPNHFAQAQAASLGLPSVQYFNSHTSSSSLVSQEAESHLTIDEMKHVLENSIPNATIVELNPFYLTPGSDLAVLSNGQLEILEQAHQLALTQIMETRIANARAQERMWFQEWMKNQREILHDAKITSASSAEEQE